MQKGASFALFALEALDGHRANSFELEISDELAKHYAESRQVKLDEKEARSG